MWHLTDCRGSVSWVVSASNDQYRCRPDLRRCRPHAASSSTTAQWLRCLTVQLRETEIDELIRKGLLKSETRNDRNAIIKALYDHFDRTLGRKP